MGAVGFVESVGEVRAAQDGCRGRIEVPGDAEEQWTWGGNEGGVSVGGNHAEGREQ